MLKDIEDFISNAMKLSVDQGLPFPDLFFFISSHCATVNDMHMILSSDEQFCPLRHIWNSLPVDYGSTGSHCIIIVNTCRSTGVNEVKFTAEEPGRPNCCIYYGTLASSIGYAMSETAVASNYKAGPIAFAFFDVIRQCKDNAQMTLYDTLNLMNVSVSRQSAGTQYIQTPVIVAKQMSEYALVRSMKLNKASYIIIEHMSNKPWYKAAWAAVKGWVSSMINCDQSVGIGYGVIVVICLLYL